MKGYQILTALFVTAAVTACKPENVKKPDRSMLIPENKLVEVLTDTYLAGAMLEFQEVRKIWGDRDSVLNYIDVIEDHGYTYEQMEATMKYYFASRPKRIEKIYDKVTNALLVMEDDLQKETVTASDTAQAENLWKGKRSYDLPEDFTKDPIWFDIPVDAPGRYVLKADIEVYPDDKSIDPRVTVFFSTIDSTGIEIRDDWGEVMLSKDGKQQKIDIRKRLENPQMVHIRGWLLNHTSQQGAWKKHARIKNISLTLEKDTIMLDQ